MAQVCLNWAQVGLPHCSGVTPQPEALLLLMLEVWVNVKQFPGLFLSSQILKQTNKNS